MSTVANGVLNTFVFTEGRCLVVREVTVVRFQVEELRDDVCVKVMALFDIGVGSSRSIPLVGIFVVPHDIKRVGEFVARAIWDDDTNEGRRMATIFGVVAFGFIPVCVCACSLEKLGAVTTHVSLAEDIPCDDDILGIRYEGFAVERKVPVVKFTNDIITEDEIGVPDKAGACLVSAPQEDGTGHFVFHEGSKDQYVHWNATLIVQQIIEIFSVGSGGKNLYDRLVCRNASGPARIEGAALFFRTT